MAKKQVTPETSPLVDAAIAIGSAAGKVASMLGVNPGATAKKPANGKLPKKNKARLPRKEKKSVAKKAVAKTAVAKKKAPRAK